MIVIPGAKGAMICIFDCDCVWTFEVVCVLLKAIKHLFINLWKKRDPPRQASGFEQIERTERRHGRRVDSHRESWTDSRFVGHRAWQNGLFLVSDGTDSARLLGKCDVMTIKMRGPHFFPVPIARFK